MIHTTRISLSERCKSSMLDLWISVSKNLILWAEHMTVGYYDYNRKSIVFPSVICLPKRKFRKSKLFICGKKLGKWCHGQLSLKHRPRLHQLLLFEVFTLVFEVYYRGRNLELCDNSLRCLIIVIILGFLPIFSYGITYLRTCILLWYAIFSMVC